MCFFQLKTYWRRRAMHCPTNAAHLISLQRCTFLGSERRSLLEDRSMGFCTQLSFHTVHLDHQSRRGLLSHSLVVALRSYLFVNSESNASSITGGICKSTGVIYAVNCKKCKQIYVGHTGKTMAERWSKHKSSIGPTKTN